MARNHYNRKDYSNLLKELQNAAKSDTEPTASGSVHSETPEGVDKGIYIDFNLDILLSSIKDLSDLVKLYDFCEEQVDVEQQITQDLLHAIEFSTSCKERYKYSTTLHYNRQRRRQYKDAMTVLKPVIEFIQKDENKKMLNRLTNLLGEARKTRNHSSDRTYSPRVLTELGVFINGKSDR